MRECFSGEARKMAMQKTRTFSFVDFEHAGSLTLREPPRTNHFSDANGKIGFCEAFMGTGQTDVGENVPATLLYGNLIARRPSFASGHHWSKL